MRKYTIHEDQTISHEAAKLLGVPFTWGSRYSAFKYVPTDKGLDQYRRILDESYPVQGWVHMVADTGITAEDLYDEDTGKPHTLYRVTFHDEQEANHAPDPV